MHSSKVLDIHTLLSQPSRGRLPSKGRGCRWLSQVKVGTFSVVESVLPHACLHGVLAGRAASDGVLSDDELSGLCHLRDDELRERLPEIGESEVALALMSPEGRRARIRAAMAARDAQRTLDFRQRMEARQQDIREDKNRAAAEGIDLPTPVKKQRNECVFNRTRRLSHQPDGAVA